MNISAVCFIFAITFDTSMIESSRKKCSCFSCDLRDIVFAHLSDEDIECICASKEEIMFTKGDLIHNQGDRVKNFKYLKEGLVKLYRQDGNGNQQIITITRPHEFVSNTNVFFEDHYRYSLAALEDSVACCINIDLMKEMIAKYGSFGLNLISVLSRTSENIIALSLELRSRNLAGRVAYVLIYFSTEIYHSNMFDLPVSRREIADFISMSSANVIRTFSEFRHDGIIKSYGRTIEIVDMNKLKVISKLG
jgi:CRP/FNR family transcriptional regulator